MFVCLSLVLCAFFARSKKTPSSSQSTTHKKTTNNHPNTHQAFLKEQDDIKHIKQFIASCGTFSNLVKQAKSKQKILDKMYEAGLTPDPRVGKERAISFKVREWALSWWW